MPIAEDGGRVDPTSQFAASYLSVLDEVEALTSPEGR
jgi:hypothetical protein